MFALHETTQRRVCRVTFIALCVVPTLLTLVGIAYCNRPWRQSDWQRTLAQRLHVRAELGGISRPRPGMTELCNLQLADLRTNSPLGSIDKLSFHRKNSRQLFRADHLTVEAAQLPDFLTAVTTWLATGELELLDFETERLTITGPSLHTLELTNLTIRSETTDANGQQFQLNATGDTGETIQLALESEQGKLRCIVDAQQVPLPAWLVGQLVPGVGSCGKAIFLGKISATRENQNLRGQLQGTFEQVDLQAWIGIDGPHRLQGIAQVKLEQLDWSGEGIEVVRGSLQTGQGASSFSLLEAMGELFACVPGSDWQALQPATPGELIAFDQLAFRFQMSDEGITLAGECANGELILGQQGPLLYAPQEKPPFAVAQFVRLFHQPQQGWLPDTRGAHAMARELPLPENPANRLKK